MHSLKKKAVSTGMIYGVIVAVILAFILLNISVGLLPQLVVAVHNLSDALAIVFTSIGLTTLATIFGSMDEWFGYAFAGGLVILLVVLGMNMFKSRGNKGRGYRGFRRRRY